MNIIPAIDIVSGKCVRLYQGDYDKKTVYSEDPSQVAADWEKQGAKFLHLVDLDGAKAGKLVNVGTIKSICSAIKIPCELGGGIRSINDAQTAFNCGVSRVIIGTAAIKNPELVIALIQRFGSDKIVLGLDAKDGMVAINGWVEVTHVEAIAFAKQFAALGIKRFIYTDISKDGVLCGPNLKMTSLFCKELPSCQVIASGGVGSIDDVKELMSISKIHANLEALIVGKALYEKRVTLEKIAELT